MASNRSAALNASSIDVGSDSAEFIYSDPNSTLGMRLRKFAKNNNDRDGLERFKNAQMQIVTSWSIFSALLMTVGFGGCLVSRDDFYISENEDSMNSKEIVDIVSYFYVGLMYSSAVLSLLAVVFGTQSYNLYSNVPLHMLDKAIAAYKVSYRWTAVIVYVSLATVSIGTTIGVWLLFGFGYFIVVILFNIAFIAIFAAIGVHLKKTLIGLGLLVDWVATNKKENNN